MSGAVGDLLALCCAVMSALATGTAAAAAARTSAAKTAPPTRLQSVPRRCVAQLVDVRLPLTGPDMALLLFPTPEMAPDPPDALGCPGCPRTSLKVPAEPGRPSALDPLAPIQ